jgi:hypothetical protein
MSASKIPTLHPFLARDAAKLTVMVDFPTPPLADETAIIESTPDIFFFCLGCNISIRGL